MPRDFNQAVLDGLNRIEDKCDKLTDKVSEVEKKQAVHDERQKIHVEHVAKTSNEIHEIKNILTSQHEQLVDHVQRSNSLQARQVEFVETQHQFRNSLVEISSKIQPIIEQRTNTSIIEEYENRKKERLLKRLTDWKTIIAFITALGGLVAYIKGWF